MDLTKLFAPISDESPTGVDLRLASGDDTIGRIKDARTEIRPEEDPAMAGGRRADWRLVRVESEKALEKQTKDLELAGYLTEGWIRDTPVRDRAINKDAGIYGLINGLTLIIELMNRYWDTLHPGYDEGEVIVPIRSRHLTWIGSSGPFLQTVAAAQLVPVAAGATFTIHELNQAQWLEQIRATQRDSYEAQAQGKRSLDEIRDMMGAFDPDVIVEAHTALTTAQATLAELNAVCGKLIPDDESPNLFGLRDLLDDAVAFVARYLPDASTDTSEGDGAGEEGEGVQGTATAGSGGGRTGPIGSRSDALRRLSEVADFFRRTEPHSPVSYLVQRAVRWGQMPFEDLLKDVVKDSAARQQVLDLLGIQGSEEGY